MRHPKKAARTVSASSPGSPRDSSRRRAVRFLTWGGIRWKSNESRRCSRAWGTRTTPISSTAMRCRWARRLSPSAATAFRSAPAWNGEIFTEYNSIRSALPPSARGCCRTSSRSLEDATDMRLIPAIDLKAGHCVRLLQGDFATETRYNADPQALLAKYRDFGADWLHVVDLDGARDGSIGNRD